MFLSKFFLISDYGLKLKRTFAINADSSISSLPLVYRAIALLFSIKEMNSGICFLLTFHFLGSSHVLLLYISYFPAFPLELASFFLATHGDIFAIPGRRGQGGPSGCTLHLVDIITKIPSQYSILILKCSSQFLSTKRSVQPDGPPCKRKGRQRHRCEKRATLSTFFPLSFFTFLCFSPDDVRWEVCNAGSKLSGGTTKEGTGREKAT